MRLLLAGAWQYPMYEEACSNASKSFGVNVIPFSLSKFFQSYMGRAELKWTIPGPTTLALNRQFITEVFVTNPDVILMYGNNHVWPSTLKRIKEQLSPVLVSLTHDDFSGPSQGVKVPIHHHLFWRHFLAGTKYYDLHLVKRKINIEHLISLGANRCSTFMNYYVPNIHRPMVLTNRERDRFGCDIVFAGHYEPDGRERYLRALVNAGLRVRLFGGSYWTRSVLGDLADYFGEVAPVFGDDYPKALCGAKMCLCFLSKWNRDTHTRRCFEIPACGRLLLSERTEELQQLFKEDKEAVFFSSPDELTEKALWLRDHPQDIERIAEAGMRRVHADGHSVYDRMKEFLALVDKIREEGRS